MPQHPVSQLLPNQAGLLEKSLTVLREWAMFVRCADEDVENERGIVVEEWRQGRTAHGRTDEDYVTTLMEGSLYAERLPIGKVDVIKNCKPSVVHNFYRKWYHPKRMAIIAVGDFDDFAGGPRKVVEMLTKLFDVEAPHSYTESVPVPFPSHPNPRLSVFQDREATNASVCVDCKRPRQPVVTEGDYRRTILEHLFHESLSNRLYKIAVSPEAPFFSASTSLSFPTSIMESFALGISVQEGQELEALEAALMEVERVKSFGFTEEELKRTKANLLSDLEADSLEREQFESEGFCNEFVEHFCRKEPAMGVGYEVELCRSILPGIKKEEVAAVVKHYNWSSNCTIKITRPKSSWIKKLFGRSASGPGDINEEDIQEVIDRVEQARSGLSAWEQSDILTFSDILKPLPPSGSVKDKKHFKGTDITEMTLSNGLRVCYKKTKFFDDEVQFKAFAFGGLSELTVEQLLSCRMSTTIASEIGAFGIPPAELVDMIAGMRVSVSMEVATYSRALAGECSPSDLEAACQMVHLLFTCSIQPEPQKIDMLMRMLREQVRNQSRSPQAVFAQRVAAVNTCGNEFFVPMKESDIDRIDPSQACSFFRHCFSDPANFTLVVCGNVEDVKLMSLIEKYLASIPKADLSELSPLPRLPSVREELKAISVKFPEKRKEEHIYMTMVDPLCCTQMTFPLVIEASDNELRQTMLLSHALQLLESRLVEKLRFEMGAIYNVSAGADFQTAHPSLQKALHGTVAVSFTCRPQDIRRLSRMVISEIVSLQEKGPTAQEIETRKEIALREYETSSKYNSWWVDRIVTSYSSRNYKGDVGASLEELERERKFVLETLDGATMQEIFRVYCPDPQRHTLVTLRPSLAALLLSSLRLHLKEKSWPYPLVVGAGTVAVGGLLLMAGMRMWKWCKRAG